MRILFLQLNLWSFLGYQNHFHNHVVVLAPLDKALFKCPALDQSVVLIYLKMVKLNDLVLIHKSSGPSC